ncbi:hypothetical protein [Streptomyces sp. NPDC127190]|uniref:hypothetical protein n=1 Tax=unclassified Streptomyces TaxID=2593676 RepID=UPI003625B03E
MGIQERDRKVCRPLRRAGLEVIPNAVPSGTMPFVRGYGAEDVAGGFSHRYDTSRLVERLNADWYDLAVSSGLFDHRREFLVQLPQGTRSHLAALQQMHSGSHAPALWTRVRLLDRRDIMGRGAASAFLGVHSGHPGFGMMALDGSVYVCARRARPASTSSWCITRTARRTSCDTWSGSRVTTAPMQTARKSSVPPSGSPAVQGAFRVADDEIPDGLTAAAISCPSALAVTSSRTFSW